MKKENKSKELGFMTNDCFITQTGNYKRGKMHLTIKDYNNMQKRQIREHRHTRQAI